MLQHRCPTLPALWGGPGMVDKTRVESLASATQSACVRVSHIQQGIRFNVNPDANVKRLVHLLLRWTDWLAAAECRWWRWYILERAKGNIQDSTDSDGCKFTCDTVQSLYAFICKRTHLHSNYAHMYIQNHKRLLYIYTTGAQTCQPTRTLAKEQNTRKRQIRMHTTARCVN